MIPVLCLAQHGQIPAEQAASLAAEIDAFSLRAFDRPAAIDWVTVPAGSGFTAGERSTSIILSVQSNRPLPRLERAALLHELCDTCMNETGKSPDEVVVSILDPRA